MRSAVFPKKKEWLESRLLPETELHLDPFLTDILHFTKANKCVSIFSSYLNIHFQSRKVPNKTRFLGVNYSGNPSFRASKLNITPRKRIEFRPFFDWHFTFYQGKQMCQHFLLSLKYRFSVNKSPNKSCFLGGICIRMRAPNLRNYSQKATFLIPFLD